ncbi:MAG: AAA family ATPase [Pseudomonadales bacterium]
MQTPTDAPKATDVSPGRIILLHGPSSAGKSTIAASLQARLDEPFLHLSFDHFRASGVLPLAGMRAGKVDWLAMREPFFDGFHRAAAAFASSGNNIIVEHIIETQEWMNTLLSVLSSIDVFFVEVYCPLPELERREFLRGDRRVGDARRDFATIQLDVEYDLRLFGTDPPETNVEKLIHGWRNRARPSAFERMAS